MTSEKPSGSSGEKAHKSANTGSGEPEDESRDELSDMGFVSQAPSYNKMKSDVTDDMGNRT